MSETPSSSLSDADLQKIAAMFAAALKAVAPVSPSVNIDELVAKVGAEFGSKVAEGINAAQPPRKVSIGEYLRRTAPKAKLKDRTYHENGRRIDEHLLCNNPDDTEFVDLLNRVTRSGKYFGGDVSVDYIVAPGGHVDLHIKWYSGDNDRRRDIERKFGTDGIRGAWRTIVAEQEKAAEEEAEAKRETEARRYSFGSQRDIQKAAHAARQAAEAHA